MCDIYALIALFKNPVIQNYSVTVWSVHAIHFSLCNDIIRGMEEGVIRRKSQNTLCKQVNRQKQTLKE